MLQFCIEKTDGVIVSDVVFLTGGTGFIGTQIAKRLLGHPDLRLLVLVRAENKETATLRLKRAWWEFPELAQQIGNRIEVVHGNLCETYFGLADNDYLNIVKTVTHIIHAAANVTPNLELEKLRKINVKGTENVIELAKRVNGHHGLSRLSYVSTAYVAGKRKGTVNENELSDSYGFCSNYEKSKYSQRIFSLEGVNSSSHQQSKSGHGRDADKENQASPVFLQEHMA